MSQLDIRNVFLFYKFIKILVLHQILHTKESGKTVNNMEKEPKSGQMEACTKESGKTINNIKKEPISGQMEKSKKESGKKKSKMKKEP